MGARQRSGEGVVRRNGCPKGCRLGESVSSLLPSGFQDLSGVLRENLKGAEKKRTLQKHPFGQPFLCTTPSPLLWRALIKAVWDTIALPNLFGKDQKGLHKKGYP